MDWKVIDLSHSFSLFLSLSLSFSLSYSLFLSLSLIIYLPTYRSIYLSIYRSISLSLSLSLSFVYLTIYLSIYLTLSDSIWLYLTLSDSIWLYLTLSDSIWLYLLYETSSFFQVHNIKNEALLRDFLIFWSWQHQKWSNSARLPYFSKLTTSQTKHFCETSSFFQLDNIKNKAILRDFLQKWKVERRANSFVPMRFAIFLVHLSKVLRLPRKSDAKSYEVLHLSCKIISANLKIWRSKMQPLSGNQRPDLLTSLMNMSFVLRLQCKMHLWRSSSNVPRLTSLLEMLQNPHVLLTFDKVHNPLRLPRESTSERPKVLRTRQFFALLTSKCASRHNGVHFFDISTSKSGPELVCFVHFDFKMCFAQHKRALFRHLNFQKWSGAGVLCTFWFQNVLRATPACTFSTSQLPKVVRS